MIALNDLTAGTLDGAGVFDALMRANKAHLDTEYAKSRLRGPEYAAVYTGMIESVMQTSMSFLMQRQRIDLEAQLLTKQIELADKQISLADKELLKADAQIALINAQISDTNAKTSLTAQQEANLVAEALNIPKTGEVLDAQKCKLQAEYDLILSQTLKSGTENELLAQKVVTEKAQVLSLGVDDNSVIGKQKALYTAQTDGFKRDAEQKVAKIFVDTWSARRMTDEATIADATNMLNDPTIGRAITKLLAGIGA